MIKNESTLEGFFDFSSFYEGLVRGIPENGRFAELGVYQGASICFAAQLAARLGKNISFYAIDIWQSNHLYNKFLYNCISTETNHMIKPLRGPSELQLLSFPANFFDVIFIDSSHKYEHTCREIELSLEKSKDVISGHDYNLKPVRQAVLDMLGDNHEINGNCWIYRKSDAYQI